MEQFHDIQMITTSDGHTLAYHALAGDSSKPVVLFLGGFMSDMNGTKATALHQWAHVANRSFVRFDYVGHGRSSGVFTDGTIGLWLDNVIHVFDQLTRGPVIVVGSSMGGWLMLLLALKRSQRIHGLVGIASAPDFTEALIWETMNQSTRDQLQQQGYFSLQSDYGENP